MVPKGIGVFRKVNLFGLAIPDANFEVYEGVGAESFSITEALKRDDLAQTVRFILEKEQGEMDVQPD